MEEGTHAELMKIDVVKGKPLEKTSDDATSHSDEQKAKEAKADVAKAVVGEATEVAEGKKDNQAGGQAKDAPADEEVTLSGFYHLMWDTQMVR